MTRDELAEAGVYARIDAINGSQSIGLDLVRAVAIVLVV